MSLQWTLIAGFLYVEIATVLILILPIFSPKRWNNIFKSRIMVALKAQASWYFMFVLLVLILFLLDAIREMRKYSNVELSEHAHAHLDAEMQANMRLFRAQRNFYISGFSLFLSLVIKRLLLLISAQAALMADNEAALSQAKSATTTARNLLARTSSAGEGNDEKVVELEEKLQKLTEEMKQVKVDKEAIKTQAASVTKEYDRLMEEHRKLQAKVESGDKKGD